MLLDNDDDDSPKRGTKRKRSESTAESHHFHDHGPKQSDESKGAIDIDKKLSGKLHHDLREVKKAARKAKSFETQKLVKRLKNLRFGKVSGKATIDDAESQLEIVKRIDPDLVGTTALARKIRKDRVLSGHVSLLVALQAEVAAVPHENKFETGPAPDKVLHRLLSSRTLAKTVSDIIDDLRHVVSGDSLVPKKVDDEVTVRGAKRLRLPVKNGDRLEPKPGTILLPRVSSADHIEVASEDSDNDGSDVESIAINQLAQEGRPGSKSTPATDVQVGTSTFLPSLAVGFTRGDSTDSNWGGGETDIADGAQKKNRRGQRARRAIWEKKYGQNANHKRREREAAGARAAKRHVDQARGRPQLEPTVNPILAARGARDSMHPSWVAKKRLKEKELGASGRGKKIRF